MVASFEELKKKIEDGDDSIFLYGNTFYDVLHGFTIIFSKLDYGIDDEGVKAIVELLKTNTSVTKIDLEIKEQSLLSHFILHEENKIGVDGAKAIAELLKTNTTITKLELESNSRKTVSY